METRRWLLALALLATAHAQFVQQGSKLVGSGAIGPSDFGESVAVSADGNTALIGGDLNNGYAGAAWVFTRNGGVWTQQTKLVGSGAIGPYFAQQGISVGLSADGSTAIVGGSEDSNGAGAAWVFTRVGGVWTQQSKLVGGGAIGGASQGQSVALSADGNTALIGGPIDNPVGAAWVFTRGRDPARRQAGG